MYNPFLFIKNYFRNRKYKKYIIYIDTHLSNVQFNVKLIDNKLEKLREQRIIITNEHIQKVRDSCNHVTKYLTDGNLFSINNETLTFYEKEKTWIVSTKEYNNISKKFESIKTIFLNKLESIDQWSEKVNKDTQKYANLADRFLQHIDKLRDDYITTLQITGLTEPYSDAYFFFKGGNGIQDQKLLLFLVYYENLKDYVVQWNMDYIQKGLEEHKDLFDNIDGKSLDQQQRVAVLTDEDNNLILAGAGSGKTLTISGKVKFLVDKKQVKPNEILLISFTNKASKEMYERISRKLNVEVDVYTFHKLGLEIISKNKGKRPEIFDGIQEVLNSYMHNEIYSKKGQIQKIIEFFGFYINIPKDLDEFDNLADLHDYYRNVDFETIKGKVKKTKYVDAKAKELSKNLQTLHGETVKSLEEFLIANFLFLNGINYIYEKPYEYETNDQFYRQYKPDFYLPDYDLYIEHFGVNEKMKAPWLCPMEEAKYIEGMEWKRALHKQNGTTLIESFSYYNKKGVLLENLRVNLLKYMVEFKEIEFKEIFSSIYDQTKDKYFTEFLKLIGTFIGLFKSNGFSEDMLDKFIAINQKKEPNVFLQKRTQLFLELVKPVYLYYQDYLEKIRAIDFNDMINLATEIVNLGEESFNYKYIIIDEYQDISKSRYKLVKAIKDKTNAKVMGVGDDWQSIYRFAGSDIQLFTRFGDYFGAFELLRIEKTYRNSQKLIDIAGKFVMQNPNQYTKELKSDKINDNPVRLIGYQNNMIEALEKVINEIVVHFGEYAEIMLLGRNNFDIDVIEKHRDFQKRYDKAVDKLQIVYSPYPNLNMFFLTSHRSKGLEADNVILINATNSLLGFPNKISDDPVLSLVLTDSDNFPFAEERRLFYVALTRTKYNTYILTPERKMSIFVKELIDNHGIKYGISTNEQTLTNNPNCPKCLKGYLIMRTSNDQKFLGCTNFPTCDYTVRHVEILNNQIKCRICGGFMVMRKGKFGEFYGCTNYPKCTSTIKLESKRHVTS